jgi:hypothetical protein
MKRITPLVVLVDCLYLIWILPILMGTGVQQVINTHAPGAANSIVCVQGGAGCTNTAAMTVDCGGGNTGCGKAFGVNVTNNNYILFIGVTGPAAVNTTPATINTPTDTVSSSWTCGTQTNFTAGGALANWVGINACIAKFTHATAADTVTAHLSTNGDLSFTIFEVNGLATGAIDTTATAEVNSGASSATTGTYTTTAANEIVIGNVADDEQCLTGGSAGTGFTLITQPSCTSIGYYSEYQIYSSTQSGATASINFTGDDNSVVEIGFKVYTFK